MRKINIAYDMDDVLNNLGDSVFESMDLADKTDKLKQFSMESNVRLGILTNEQSKLLLNAFSKPESFMGLIPMQGIERLMDIEEKYPNKVNVSIYTHALDESIDCIKQDFVKTYIPKMPLERVHITHESVKEAKENIDIIVEDNLENLLRYKYRTVKILINKPYNQFENYLERKDDIEKAGNLMRVANLQEAITLVEKLVDGGWFND